MTFNKFGFFVNNFFSFSTEFKITFSFLLLFGLIPYRLLGLFGITLPVKFFLGVLFLILFFHILKDAAPVFLNSFFLQTFFFFCLRTEEYLCTTNFFLL